MRGTGFYGDGGIAALYEDVVILTGKRTPFGDFCKSLARVNPTDLGIVAARAALGEAGIRPDSVHQVAFANVNQSSADAYYLPRHIGLYCGIPQDRPAVLLQRICGSGFETLIYAAEQIVLGKAGIVLAGGTENMSLNPTAAYGLRLGHDLGNPGFVDTLWASLLDPACGCTMGQTAENLAQRYGISREEVDRFALESQERYFHAAEEGFFGGEIAPVRGGKIEQEGLRPRRIQLPRGVEEVTADEHPRQTSLEKLAALPPVFRKDGVQTAGNSSGIVDGAAAVVVASRKEAEMLEQKPLCTVVASATVGVAPDIMGIGPAPAIRRVLEVAGLRLDEIDLFEINEAFGAQCLAVLKELELPVEKVNVNGGAIAIGHPLAATGTRLVLTLARQLRKKGKTYGIASACIGGGQGTAVLIRAE